MGKAVKIRNVKIKTVDDLKHAKEIFRYEARVNEQTLLSGFKHCGDLIRISAQTSMQYYGRKLMYHALIRLLKSRK